MLSNNQLKNVCLAWEGSAKTCRFLESRPSGHQCMKLRPEAQQINIKVNEFLSNCKKKGLDPTTQGAPLGDNCQGCLVLKSIQVGQKDT